MRNLKLFFGLAILSLSAVACGPKGNTVETSDAQEAASSENAMALVVNAENSMVTWIGSKPAGKHNGTINITDGEVSVSDNDIVAGNFTFDITSLTSLDLEEGSENYQKLTGHLMSADFFDAETHPTASFEVTGVKPFSADELMADEVQFETDNKPATLSEVMVDNPTHFISGNLTMRGTTKNITFPASVSLENGMLKAMANFNIDRTDWGLMYGDEASVADKAKDQFIYNTVNVGFELEAGTGSM